MTTSAYNIGKEGLASKILRIEDLTRGSGGSIWRCRRRVRFAGRAVGHCSDLDLLKSSVKVVRHRELWKAVEKGCVLQTRGRPV